MAISKPVLVRRDGLSNSNAIECPANAWAVGTAERADPGSLLNAHPRFVRRLSWLDIVLGLLAMMAAAALGQSAGQHAMAAVGISALGLAWLHDRCDRFSTDFLRVTADFGLYTPLLFFAFNG